MSDFVQTQVETFLTLKVIWDFRLKLLRTVSRVCVQKEGLFMSFGLYVLGYLIVTAGLIYAASILHVPQHWIVAGAVVLVGLGILTGVKATRQKDTGA